ncbi:MAG: hypothetical protein RLZZ416_256 [Candidatus Parcubacteria bacterium]|jgi:hypothetical protein
MWGIMLQINSACFIITSVYLVYSFGTAIMMWAWKPFGVALVLFIFFALAEIALAAIAEP